SAWPLPLMLRCGTTATHNSTVTTAIEISRGGARFVKAPQGLPELWRWLRLTMEQSSLKGGRKIAFSYALASTPGPRAMLEREPWRLRLSWKLQADGFARPDLFSIRRRLMLMIAAG